MARQVYFPTSVRHALIYIHVFLALLSFRNYRAKDLNERMIMVHSSFLFMLCAVVLCDNRFKYGKYCSIGVVCNLFYGTLWILQMNGIYEYTPETQAVMAVWSIIGWFIHLCFVACITKRTVDEAYRGDERKNEAFASLVAAFILGACFICGSRWLMN